MLHGDSSNSEEGQVKWNAMYKECLEWKEMESIPYASLVGWLLYAQTHIRPNISFVVGMLGQYQSNPWLDH